MSSGAIKMYLIHRAMEFRREHQELFMRGEYVPLKVAGERANQVAAFARTYNDKRVIVMCGRFFMNLAEAPPLPVDPNAWAGTFVELESDSSTSMTELISGRAISIARGRIAADEAFAKLPVAMLHD